MKKTASVLVLTAGCTAAACAQDDMTLYGVVDAGIASTHASDPGGARQSAAGMISGGLADTLFGLKGRQDLPGGWSAYFQLESMFDGATGLLSDTDRLFDSQAWVGVGSDGAGQLRLGRQHTVAEQFGNQLEVASWKQMDLGATFKASDNYQVSQAVNYLSPQLAGFRFGAGYSFDVSDHINGKSPSASLAARFERGPWLLIATWNKTYLSDAVLPDARNPSAWQLGARYDAGFASVSLAWSRQKNGYAGLDGGDPDSLGAGLGAVAFANGGHLDAYLAGISVPIAPRGQLLLQWSYVKPNWRWQDGERARSGQVATLGYVYALSPRTKLYAMAGVAKRYSLLDQVVQGQGTTTRYMAGISHSF